MALRKEDRSIDQKKNAEILLHDNAGNSQSHLKATRLECVLLHRTTEINQAMVIGVTCIESF